MSKVTRTDEGFKQMRFDDLEGPSMGHPGNTFLIFLILLTENVMHLLGKRHVIDASGCHIVGRWWDTREITDDRFHGKDDRCLSHGRFNQ
eukprot:scaffold1221_cov207-Amphora_coffeaeformis.AAC.32